MAYLLQIIFLLPPPTFFENITAKLKVHHIPLTGAGTNLLCYQLSDQ